MDTTGVNKDSSDTTGINKDSSDTTDINSLNNCLTSEGSKVGFIG